MAVATIKMTSGASRTVPGNFNENGSTIIVREAPDGRSSCMEATV